eukprot:XP_006513803.1 PREDICTED: protein phosphatase 1H isoform X1 [Mus musculus]
MLTRVKSAVANFMGGIMAGSSGSEHGGSGCGGSDLPLRFPYGRPEFLGLSQDEVECSADHIARPILILKETRRLPWATGYAEVINAGKSTHNEDQASCEVLTVKKKAGTITSTPNRNSKRRSSLPNGEGLQLKENSESEGISCHYWSLFDGHAGSGAAVVASRLLQHHITQQLQDIVEILKNSAILPPTCLGEEPESTPAHGRTLTRAASLRGGVGAPGSPSTPPTRFFTEKKIPHECLVIGALESAFKEMDLQIERERSAYNISGGCTALIVVCLLGKLYVANAGDSRAIIIRNGEIIPMSSEFTPETERQRLQYLKPVSAAALHGGQCAHKTKVTFRYALDAHNITSSEVAVVSCNQPFSGLFPGVCCLPGAGHGKASSDKCRASESAETFHAQELSSQIYSLSLNLLLTQEAPAGQCWRMPLIPALGRQRQVDF